MWRLVPILLICQNVLGALVEPRVDPRTDPLVETELGLIRGLPSDDGQYSRFLGIPFAVVDVEDPFALSTPHGGFNGTFDAYDGTIECPQSIRGNLFGEIQCLVLNIYVPNTANSTNRLPVMVWIHGGAFVEGSGAETTFSPKYFMPHDVILVSINYRLGLYGFMCTDSPKAPGNVGLKDQVSALKWINEHIEAFGGDKDKITIFGESAGGMSVHLHVLSPYENLFHNAIIQSGPANSPFTIVAADNNVALQVAEKLGLVTTDVEEALDFISKADVNTAITAAGELESPSTNYPYEPLTKPCVEKEFEGIERFITVHANDAITEKVKTIPVIIGFTSQELILHHGNEDAAFFENFSFKDLLRFGFDVTHLDEVIDSIRHFYIGDEAPSTTYANEITDFASDFVFNHPSERAIDNFLAVGPKAVYYFMFSYDGDQLFDPNASKNITTGISNSTGAVKLDGVSHGMDLGYIFPVIGSSEIPAADQLTIDRMTKLWTNFAKYGDPTPETSELLPVKWEVVTKDTEPYLDIDADLTLPSRPFNERMTYWDLFYEMNAEHIKTPWQ